MKAATLRLHRLLFCLALVFTGFAAALLTGQDLSDPVGIDGEIVLPDAEFVPDRREASGTLAEDPASLYHDALGFYAQRKLKQSRECLEKLIKDHPDHPLAAPAFIELAKVLYDLREFDKAIELLTTAANDKNHRGVQGMARTHLIRQLSELNRFTLGVELMEKWWTEDPADVELGRKLASFYLQTGKPDEAKLLLEGLLERTTSREVFQDLLNLATKSGTLEGLLNTIEQRRVRYRTIDYLDFASDCHLAMGDEKKAGMILREAPETKTSLSLVKKLGRIDFSLKEYARALESFEIIQRQTPLDWENVKALGDCHFLLGKKEEAIKAWRSPISRHLYPAPEGFQMLADVLIEHQLYQEALDILEEARGTLGNPYLFAEDRARVLEAINRHDEAIEEYLNALSYGSYRYDIFDKLYNNQNASFSLKLRLQESLKTAANPSLKKSLLEVLFREKRPETIPEFFQFDLSDGFMEDLLLERVQQTMTEDPSAFLHQLMLAVIGQNRQSSLAFRLGSLLLQFPDQNEEQKKATYAETQQLLAIDPPPDIVQKIQLLIDLGKFCLEQTADGKRAEEFARQALELKAESLQPEAALEALLFLMRLEALKEQFPAAADFLKRAQDLAGAGNDEIPPRLVYEKAWLEAQQGNFQPALNELKALIDQYPESLWVNNALSLGLSLTMGSEGQLDTLNRLLAAERAGTRGDIATAVAILTDLEKVATDTPLLKDIQARKLLLSAQASGSAAILPDLDTWLARNPAHWAVPDLLMLKWRILRESPGNNETAIVELLKDFQERFPGDLRCRRAKLVQQELFRNKGGK